MAVSFEKKQNVKRRKFCDKNTKIMSNSQKNLQIIANFAKFLVNNRRKPSSEDQKGTCPNGQVPLLNMSELFYSSTAACAAANGN